MVSWVFHTLCSKIIFFRTMLDFVAVCHKETYKFLCQCPFFSQKFFSNQFVVSFVLLRHFPADQNCFTSFFGFIYKFLPCRRVHVITTQRILLSDHCGDCKIKVMRSNSHCTESRKKLLRHRCPIKPARGRIHLRSYFITIQGQTIKPKENFAV